MINENIIKTYSDLHSYIQYTNDDSVSFNGSQIQYEFFTAWDKISQYYVNKKPKRLSFLEVGAWKGLWGLAFLEFCKLNNIEGTYVTLTMIDQDPNNQPLYKTIEYLNSQDINADLIDINSLSEQALPEVLKHSNSFDIVFIDAAHDYDSVMSDINKFAPLAKDILLFHDIRPKKVTYDCGVYQAILDSSINLDEQIITNEMTMGIGIVYIKN